MFSQEHTNVCIELNLWSFFSKCINCSSFIFGANFQHCTAPITCVCTAAQLQKGRLVCLKVGIKKEKPSPPLPGVQLWKEWSVTVRRPTALFWVLGKLVVIPVTIPLFPMQVCLAVGVHYGRDDNLGSSYQETQSICEHVLGSHCRNQPSKRNWKITWAPRSTSVISFLSFFLLSFIFLIFCLFALLLPHPFTLLFYPVVPFPFLLFMTGPIHLPSFYSLQLFSLLKAIATCCAFNIDSLEKTEFASNSKFLEKYPHNIVSWACFLSLFHLIFGKISFFNVLVNRTISYLGYTSKPCHLCITLVLSNKKTSGYFSTDFLLHLSPHMIMFIVNYPSPKPELFGSENLLAMLQIRKISYGTLQENTVNKQ